MAQHHGPGRNELRGGPDPQPGDRSEPGQPGGSRAVLESRIGAHAKQPRGPQETLRGLGRHLRKNSQGRRDPAALSASTMIKLCASALSVWSKENGVCPCFSTERGVTYAAAQRGTARSMEKIASGGFHAARRLLVRRLARLRSGARTELCRPLPRKERFRAP